jgi:TldD protein
MFDSIDVLKPALKKLIGELRKEYAYASVLAVADDTRSWSISSSGRSISSGGWIGGTGFVVRVFDGTGCAEYSFNEFSEDMIPSVAQTLRTRLAAQNAALPSGVRPLPTPVPADEPAVLRKDAVFETDPRELGDEAILERISAVREKALAVEGVLDAGANLSYRAYRKLFLSENRDLDQTVMWTNGHVFALAPRGEELKEAYRSCSILGGAELLDSLGELAVPVAEQAVELLNSEPMIPGEYDCICDPATTGMIVHEAFGHGVEMDMFVKDRAQARLFIDKPVASPLVTMHDGNAVCDTATMWFDDEGVLTGDTVIIDRGILRRGMCDTLSALRLGVAPTGNGRRESYERKAYTRMTNTYFEGGSSTLDGMMASISYGFLLESPFSGMEDPKNWGIQCMVNIAREIRDGKLTGRIFSPIVLTGYVPDLLKSVSMMCPDPVTEGGGFCGKGSKEWVKVSDGGPYMKARIRLG